MCRIGSTITRSLRAHARVALERWSEVMSVPFRIHVASEHQNVEPGRGKIWSVIKIEAHGPALEAVRAPLAVVLAVDVSGSMDGEPLAHALQSCRLVSDRLGP